MLSLGLSRGFAFVEFYHLQDATSWMEANQVASLAKSRILLKIWHLTYVCNRDGKAETRTGGGGEGRRSHRFPGDLDMGVTLCVHYRYLPLPQRPHPYWEVHVFIFNDPPPHCELETSLLEVSEKPAAL